MSFLVKYTLGGVFYILTSNCQIIQNKTNW